jgi:hypothetical protein
MRLGPYSHALRTPRLEITSGAIGRSQPAAPCLIELNHSARQRRGRSMLGYECQSATPQRVQPTARLVLLPAQTSVTLGQQPRLADRRIEPPRGHRLYPAPDVGSRCAVGGTTLGPREALCPK